MLYSLVGIVALLVGLIINGDVLFVRNVQLNMKAMPRYRLFLFAAGVVILSDILWGIFYFEANIPAVCDVVTAFFFFSMVATVFGWVRFAVSYLDEKNAVAKILSVVAYVILVVGWATIIVNFFHPILFTFSSEEAGQTYVPKIGRLVLYVTQSVIFLLTGIHAFLQARKHTASTRSRFLAIGSFCLMMAVAIILQVFFSEAPLYTAGLALGITVLRIFVLADEKRDYVLALQRTEERAKQQEETITSTKALAYTDPLTGAKNKHAYVEIEVQADTDIREGRMGRFALAVFDLNDLKAINDTKGHEAGDQYLKKSYQMICAHFPGAPIYRYGGDEFVADLRGDAFDRRYESIAAFNEEVDKNLGTGEPVVATGLADFRLGEDNTLRAVFDRADEAMYIRKRKLKQTGNPKFGMREDIYEHFYRNRDVSLIELLNNNPADDILEIDLAANTCKNFYHTEGKYAVPPASLGFRELVTFVHEHIVHPDDLEIYDRLVNPDRLFERLAKGRIPNFDFAQFRLLTPNGEYRYVEQVMITGEENEIAEGTFRIYLFDIQNLVSRQHGKGFEREATVDKDANPLTGLLMEEAFFRKAQDIISIEKEKPWCFACIDIEHFKFFDEWYGKETGDLMLSKVGAALRQAEGEYGGLAGYLGQDDFVFLCPHDITIIHRLYESIRGIIISFGLSIGFLPAIGVASVEEGLHAVDAYDRANIALTHAKKDIRNRISLFDDRLKTEEEGESRILSDFMAGMRNDEFTFYLQPQVRISTGKIVGAEALARWIRSDGSITPPNVYIPVLEKYGFIADLDQLLWDKVCAWLSSWIKAGHRPVPVSVNVSRSDIFTMDIAAFFHDLTKKYELPHNLVKLEITESAYGEATDVIRPLVKELREDGFIVLMDDFGSGYSSLNMLSNLDIDVIKLDAGFLAVNSKDESRGIHIVESVINMAKIIGLPVVVEGVENQQQSDFLQSLGCRYAQGYFFHRPMPIGDFESLISDENLLDYRGFVVKTNEQFRIREFLDKNIYSDSMLNSILGPVAIYSWDGKEHLDIVRFNQQFYEAVNVPGFDERISHIERWMPEDDLPKIASALTQAMEDKLRGAIGVFHFANPNGTMATFRIHFFYLGKKEGEERFYGSAMNITVLTDLQDEMKFIGDYGNDNLIFIERIEGNWHYRVASHGLSDFFGISIPEFEKELNDGRFSKRFASKNDQEIFRSSLENLNAEEKGDFTKSFAVKGKNGEKKQLLLSFHYVGDQSYNIAYVLRTTFTEEA